jgi:antirestriction protein
MNQPPPPGRPEPSEAAETNEALNEYEPRIYVASLADYNAGRLHGRWIAANQEPETLWEEINEMLAESMEPLAEEWAIHDYEGFGPLRLSEYESIERISTLARGIAEHGRAFAHWADYLGPGQDDDLDRFEENYRGHWSSTTEFAESFLDDIGVQLDSLVDEQWQPYVTFDLDAFARDLSFDFHVSEDDEGVYVFDNT